MNIYTTREYNNSKCAHILCQIFNLMSLGYIRFFYESSYETLLNFKMTCSGINLTENMKELYTTNYKTLLMKINKHLK